MSSKSKILIVEDEKNLGVTLFEFLEARGHLCELATSAHAAREAFNSNNFQIVLMDIGLPDGDGLELAKEFRELRKNFVLLFLSALNDPETKVSGLEIGADDYITKPFALKELVLRLGRIIKFQETEEDVPAEITHGSLKIWFDKYQVSNSTGEIINLSHKECVILKLLYRNMNKVIPREEIIEEAWGEDKFPSNRTVDNYIVKLRRWLEANENKILEIESIRGVGYRLNSKD